MRKKSTLKRRTIIRRSDAVPVDYICPSKSSKLLSNTAEYKYFWGHLVKEVCVDLPKSPVVCWFDDHILSLPVCAINKFLKEKTHCKRCTLFQKDNHASALKDLISKWEQDDLVIEEKDILEEK